MTATTSRSINFDKTD